MATEIVTAFSAVPNKSGRRQTYTVRRIAGNLHASMDYTDPYRFSIAGRGMVEARTTRSLGCQYGAGDTAKILERFGVNA